ncbi:DUF1173 family protein [Ramlibacter sp. AN1133]|uniref:DUF1173 family protein n=1 Tax=Ramlibacter sp. AN1133 TaxID=3133429 RepID=UPI0030BE2C54
MAPATPSTHQQARPRTVSYTVLAGGERVAQAQLREGWNRPEIQRALFAARQCFGHALCECRPEPLKLQIRLRQDRCHLAVWPQQGPAHDSECIFFHDEVAPGGSGAPRCTVSLAACETAPGDPGAAAVRGHRIALRTGPVAASEPAMSAVTIQSLAHRLWEAASLCRWHSSWTRDWGRTRYQLREAATQFSTNGCPLEELLFVPRPFRQGLARVLNQEWEAFARSLRAEPKDTPRLLIAPVRRVVAAHEGRCAAVFLRHLLAPIGLSPACVDFLWRDCRNALANSHLAAGRPVKESQGGGIVAPRSPELVGFFSVEAGPRGGVWARSGWLMAVHPSTYVPAASSNMVMLIDALVSGGHAFQHLPSGAPPGRRAHPDWLVRHVRGPDGVPVARAALEVMARSVSADYLALRHALAARMAEQGIPTWVWTPGGNPSERRVPPLPPPERMPVDEARQLMEQICGSGDADYRYGPSSKFAQRSPS